MSIFIKLETFLKRICYNISRLEIHLPFGAGVPDVAHIMQSDVDKVYAYEKLMRAYMAEEKTDKISDERYAEIVKQAGFATEDHFSYMIFRMMTLRSYIEFKYNLQQKAEDMEAFLAMVYDSEVRLKDDAVTELAKRSLEMITPPEPTAAEIKLILDNWEGILRAIDLAD